MTENLQTRRHIEQTEPRVSQISPEQEKAIEQMKSYLKGPKWWNCIRGDREQEKKQLQGYYERIGINTLEYFSNLLSYYQKEPDKLIVLDDLKVRLEKIKNNELPDYNREMAYHICDCLIKKEW